MKNKNNRSTVASTNFKPKALLLTFAVTALLGACGGGKDGQAADAQTADGPTAKALAVPPGWVGRKPPTETAKKIAQLEAAGILPKLDTSNSIAGPDVDGNGIRDDIDAYIEQQNYSPNFVSAVRQTARAYQKTIAADLNSSSNVQAAKVSMQHAIKCLRSKSMVDFGATGPASDARQQIKSITLNTKLRISAWIEFDKQMDGQILSQVEGESCE
jgi:hypothetical protein